MARLSTVILVVVVSVVAAFSYLHQSSAQRTSPCCVRGQCHYLTPDECRRIGGFLVRNCEECR